MHKRNISGYAVEFTCVSVVLFGLVLLPLLDLACIAFRTTGMIAAARDAAHAAAKGRSSDQVAQIASERVRFSANHFRGVRVQKVKTIVVRKRIEKFDGAAEIVRTPADEIDTDHYVYQIEVQVGGEIDPLVYYLPFLSRTPGINAPIPFNTTARELFENPVLLTR